MSLTPIPNRSSVLLIFSILTLSHKLFPLVQAQGTNTTYPNNPGSNPLADPCSVCNENDRDSTLIGVSKKCWDEVGAWYDLEGIDVPKECEGNESASTVSAKCKYAVVPMLKCSINPCADDYGKFKYLNDTYSCKQLNRLKKKYRKKICKKEESARKLCQVICKK